MSEASEKLYGDHDQTQAQETQLTVSATPPWVPITVIALAALSVLGLGVAWHATKQAKSTAAALVTETGHDKLVGQDLQALNQRLTEAEEVNTQLQNELVAVTDNLKMTQGEVVTARRKNGELRDDYSSKLSGVQSELARKANADDLKSLGGDVGSVRGELETTKGNLDATRTEFSALIARNHEEIDEIRRLGEHNFLDFTLQGKGSRSKVGDVMVELRGTNTKKNQFTVALYVDDLRLEKKDRAIDEPIYFYTRGTRSPSELVVNQIGKDKVVGYLSVVKAQSTRDK